MTGKLLLAFLTVSLSAGCGEERIASDDFADTYAAAEMALAEAEANRNVWSKTESKLQQSRVAYDAGRTDEAIEMATEAKLQAELALAQAVTGKETWKENVLSE